MTISKHARSFSGDGHGGAAPADEPPVRRGPSSYAGVGDERMARDLEMWREDGLRRGMPAAEVDDILARYAAGQLSRLDTSLAIHPVRGAMPIPSTARVAPAVDSAEAEAARIVAVFRGAPANAVAPGPARIAAVAIPAHAPLSPFPPDREAEAEAARIVATLPATRRQEIRR